MTEAKTRTPIVLVLSAAILGFAGGLLGALTVSQKTVRPLKLQNESLSTALEQQRQHSAELERRLEESRREMEGLVDELKAATAKTAASAAASAVRRRADQLEKSLLQRMLETENRLAQLQEGTRQTDEQHSAMLTKLNAINAEQKELLRQLKSQIAELENRIGRLPQSAP